MTEKATFGAGCFWGVEETFRNLKGVTNAAVGYAGGTKENPSYEVVVENSGRLDTGERAPFSVKKGDEVIFTSYAGTEIKLDGEELIIMSEDDVLAVVE